MLAVMPTVSVAAAKSPTFVISTAKGAAGDTVKITVSTKNNTGIVSMKLLVKYDSTAMKLTESEEGKFKNIAFGSKDSNPFIMNWIDAISPNNKTNGTVATLTFEILDTAPEGKSEISLTYDPEDVFDINFNNVTFDVQNGYVDITNSNAVSNTSSDDSQQQQSTDSTDSSDDNQTNSNIPDSTHSQILEQIYQSAQESGSSADTSSDNSVSAANDDELPKGWIIWVVVAAVVLLGGAFAVVIIKSKKDK